MRVLAWNVQGAFPPYTPLDRIDDQVRFIEESADLPDILMLNEVSRHRQGHWLDELAAIGYTEIVHTLDWAAELGESEIPPHHDYNHVNGNLTAIHEDFTGWNLTRLQPSIRYGPWEDADLKDWDTNLPEKILHATVDIGDATMELWNVRAVPGSMHGEEKVKILENTYNRIMKGSEPPIILAGDFNAPADELADGTIVPWRHEERGDLASRWGTAEFGVLQGLADKGMVDVFRTIHGYGDLDVLDVSHATATDDPLAVPPEIVEGKRFDHIIASQGLDPTASSYRQEGFCCSDHAPIVADFSPQI